MNHGTRSHKRALAEKSRLDNSSSADHHDNRHSDRQNKVLLLLIPKSQSFIFRIFQINHSHSNGSVVDFNEETTDPEPRQAKKKDRREQDKERETHEYLQKLETETKRLKSDLQQSRASEQELRIQVATLTTSEKSTKGELSLLQRQMEDLQERLQSAQAFKQADKQAIANLERRVAEERRLRSSADAQLAQERKSRKQEEARFAQVCFSSLRLCYNKISVIYKNKCFSFLKVYELRLMCLS